MALARVVSFEGVDKQHMERLVREVQEGDRPEGLPATEMMILHDADGERALAIVFFDNDEDYRQGDAALNAMDPGDTPGRRASVDKYEVALHMSVS